MIATTLLRDLVVRYRRRLAWWTAGMVSVCAIYVSFFPSVGTSMTDMVDSLPTEMTDAFGYQQMGTARGWLASTVFGVLGSTLMIGFGISTGSGVSAGEEEAGTMELELTSPLTRSQILGARVVALAFWISLLVIVTVGASYTIAWLLDMDVPFGAVAAVGGRLVVLTALFTALAIAIGAFTGRQGLAAGAASGLAALSFMADALAPSVGWDWLATISPHSWYGTGEALLIGFDASSQVPGMIAAVALGLVAFVGFARRDVA